MLLISRPRGRSLAVSFAGLALATGLAHAQYPTKTVTLVVPFAAGGPTDIVGRTLAQSMTKTLGQTVIVENVAGAGGTIGVARVAKAAPDGYTVLVHHNGMATAVGLYRKLPYDPIKDFDPISLTADVPMTLLGKKGLAPNTIAELIPYIKANREKISLANAGLGAVSHLCGMMFMAAIQTDLVTVPYKGTAPAMNDLMGGQVDIMCDQTTNTVKQIQGGTVKAYAVTTKQRIAALPNLPTLAESGLPGFEVVVWHGVYAPKGTPAPAIERLNQAVRAAMQDPEVKKRMTDLGAEITPVDRQTPAALGSWLKSEIDKWVPIIRKAGVYAD